MLIRGDRLTQRQREQVLAAFIYRWTSDNKQREYAYRNIEKPRIPLQTDDQWLAERAFHFVADGSRLMANRHYAVPKYLAA